MENEEMLRNLFELFVREDAPAIVRAAIATHFGELKYLLAKESVVGGLCDRDALVRDACIDVVTNYWHLQEVGPKLVQIMESDPQDFVRMRAAQGIGAISYAPAIPALKRVILQSKDNDALQQTAYESILSLLGRDNYDPLEVGVDTPYPIDWDLVHSL